MVLAPASILAALGISKGQRNEDAQVGVEKLERFWQHADDRVPLVVHAQFTTDDAIETARLTLGEGIAQQDDPVVPGRSFLFGEQAAANRVGPQDAKERRRHPERGDAFGGGALADSKPAELIERLALEHVGQGQAVEVVGHRRAGPLDPGAREAIEQKHQPIGFRVRQRTQQDRSDDGEDRGVRADADRQREDGCQRERAILPEQPEGETQILS